MPDLATPTDVVVQTALWLGLPALPLAAMALIAAVRGPALQARTGRANAQRAGATMMSRFRTVRWSRVSRLVAVQAAVVASVFAATRLLLILLAADSPLRSGPDLGWRQLWSRVVGYADAPAPAWVAALLALGWVLAATGARDTIGASTNRLLAAAGRSVVVLAGAAATWCAAVFCMSWFLAALDEPNDRGVLPAVGIGVIVSALVAASLGGAARLAETLPSRVR